MAHGLYTNLCVCVNMETTRTRKRPLLLLYLFFLAWLQFVRQNMVWPHWPRFLCAMALEANFRFLSVYLQWNFLDVNETNEELSRGTISSLKTKSCACSKQEEKTEKQKGKEKKERKDEWMNKKNKKTGTERKNRGAENREINNGLFIFSLSHAS